jgi:hypothetical protein
VAGHERRPQKRADNGSAINLNTMSHALAIDPARARAVSAAIR